YRLEYGTSREEHQFYTANGPVARSAAIAEWIAAHVPAGAWETAGLGLEVGAGAGFLVRELQRRHPRKTFVGVEPNAAAAEAGRRAGSDIRAGLQDLRTCADLAWAVAVTCSITATAHARSAHVL